MNQKELGKMVLMAVEWSTELSKFNGHELLVAEVTQWGFTEVGRGRKPDAVLKEMLTMIYDGIDEKIDRMMPGVREEIERELAKQDEQGGKTTKMGD